MLGCEGTWTTSPSSVGVAGRQDASGELRDVSGALAIEVVPVSVGIQQHGVETSPARADHIGVVEIADMQRALGSALCKPEGVLEDRPVGLFRANDMRVHDAVEEISQACGCELGFNRTVGVADDEKTQPLFPEPRERWRKIWEARVTKAVPAPPASGSRAAGAPLHLRAQPRPAR